MLSKARRSGGEILSPYGNPPRGVQNWLQSTLVGPTVHLRWRALDIGLLLRDKLLHDLVENYAEITPKLHAKNATPPTPKIGRGAKRRGQFCAPPVSRFLCAILV